MAQPAGHARSRSWIRRIDARPRRIESLGFEHKKRCHRMDAAHREKPHGSTSIRRGLDRDHRNPRNATRLRAGRLSVPPGHADQSVPAGRRRRCCRPSVRRDAGTDHQAAGGDRDQGRCRRRGRRAVRRQRQARRLHHAGSHRVDFRLRRSRQAVRPPAQIHARRLHPDRALHRRADGARGQCRDARTRR